MYSGRAPPGQEKAIPMDVPKDPNHKGKRIPCPRGSWQQVCSISHASQAVTCLFPCGVGPRRVGTVTVTLRASDIRKRMGKGNHKR